MTYIEKIKSVLLVKGIYIMFINVFNQERRWYELAKQISCLLFVCGYKLHGVICHRVSVCLFVYLSMVLPVCLAVCLFVQTPCISASLCLFVCGFVCLSVCMSVCSFVQSPSVSASLCLFVYGFVCLSVCMSVSFFV